MSTSENKLHLFLVGLQESDLRPQLSELKQAFSDVSTQEGSFEGRRGLIITMPLPEEPITGLPANLTETYQRAAIFQHKLGVGEVKPAFPGSYDTLKGPQLRKGDLIFKA